jgi:hypothetical protein
MTLTFMRANSIYPFKFAHATGTPDLATKQHYSRSAPPDVGGIVKHHRPAISLIGFCVMTTLGTAFALAFIVAGGTVALASHQDAQQQPKNPSITQAPLIPTPVAPTFNGMITDSYCGARHRRSSHQNSADCARACVREGATYVLVDGDHRYRLIGGDDVLEKLAGQRASVTGTRQGDTITVNSAATFLP